MRTLLLSAIVLGGAAPALADPAPGVTVMYEYNYRPGDRTLTGEDGTVTLTADRMGQYDVMVAEPLEYDVVLYVSAGGSEASMSLPADTIPGTRKLNFQLPEGEEIAIRVETAGE